MLARFRSCAVAVAAAAVLAGCDAETAEDGPEDKARTTVETFLHECAHEQPVAAAELLTAPARAQFIASGATLVACSDVLKLGGVGPPPPDDELATTFADATVTAAEANAGFAAVTVETPDGLRSTVELEEVFGRWYMANPLPADPSPEAPPADEAEQATADFLDACARERAVAAAYMLVPEAERDEFIEAPDTLAACSELISFGGEGPPPDDALRTAFEEATVTDVAVDGTVAVVTMETAGRLEGTLELEASRGRWVLKPPVP